MVSLGSMKNKIPSELPPPKAGGEMELEMEDEMEGEAPAPGADLASVSDEDLLAEIQKRGLKPGADMESAVPPVDVAGSI